MPTPPSIAAWGEKPAIIMGGTGRIVTFAELDAEANRFAHLFLQLGLSAGGVLAVCLENCPEFLQAACATMRSGLTFVPVSSKLTVGEIAHIVNDSGAQALLTSPAIGDGFDVLPDAVGGVTLITTGPVV